MTIAMFVFMYGATRIATPKFSFATRTNQGEVDSDLCIGIVQSQCTSLNPPPY